MENGFCQGLYLTSTLEKFSLLDLMLRNSCVNCIKAFTFCNFLSYGDHLRQFYSEGSWGLQLYRNVFLLTSPVDLLVFGEMKVETVGGNLTFFSFLYLFLIYLPNGSSSQLFSHSDYAADNYDVLCFHRRVCCSLSVIFRNAGGLDWT